MGTHGALGQNIGAGAEVAHRLRGVTESGQACEPGRCGAPALRPTGRVRDRPAETPRGRCGGPGESLGVAEPEVAGRGSFGRVHCGADEGLDETGSRPRDRRR